MSGLVPHLAGSGGQIVREWLSAVGTIGATTVAVYIGVLKDRWRRPTLSREFDPAPASSP